MLAKSFQNSQKFEKKQNEAIYRLSKSSSSSQNSLELISNADLKDVDNEI